MLIKKTFIFTMLALIASSIGYLVGSFPTGYILMKKFGGIDIRKVGSTSTGATNVLRTGNKKLAAITLLGDALKGIALVLAMKPFFDEVHVLYASIACLIGHSFPVWLKFKGGKGVATSAGIFLVLSPLYAIISILIWGITAKLLKISSVASIALGISFALLNLIDYLMSNNSNYNMFVFSCAVLMFLILTHRENIKRLLRKEETKSIVKKKGKIS